MRTRLFICFLLTCLLLYLGLPYLSFHTNDLQSYFSMIWVVFALIVLVGNLVGILFTKKTTQNRKKKSYYTKRTKLRGYQ